MLTGDPLHAARLALLEGALLALLREAAGLDDENDIPDGLSVRFDGGAIDIEYLRGGFVVGGEGF